MFHNNIELFILFKKNLFQY